MEFTGKLIYKGPKETVGQNNLEKLTIVLEEITDREYKGSVMVEFFKDKIGLIEPINQGAVIKVSLNPRAREYNGRRYNSIACRKVDMVDASGSGSTGAAPTETEEEFPF